MSDVVQLTLGYLHPSSECRWMWSAWLRGHAIVCCAKVAVGDAESIGSAGLRKFLQNARQVFGRRSCDVG